MEFYYLVMCMLFDLKFEVTKKNKVLKYELIKLKNSNKNCDKKREEIKFQKCSVGLLNKVIKRVKKIAKGCDLDVIQKKENVDDFEED